MVFPLVIQSGTYASCRHLFISSASLSWMEVNFLNQNPCIPSWLGVFLFDIFFSVFLRSSMYISALEPSSGPSSSLVISFIHSAFSLCFFGCHIFVQNCSVSLASGCWYVFVSCPPNCWQNFLSLFWNVLFCLYCFTLCRYLFSLPSFARTFWYISSSCTVFFFPVLSFPFSSHIFQDLSVLPFRPVFVDFLSGFPVELPILVLMVSSCFLGGPQFSHTLISPLHILEHLTQL